ncbi:hypothetical protein [Paenibacillus amylolyticus]|uniref:hypothetical protein n=1 Tax=Paenibacillus amylolyticus TaxID=1451 RepID=UPI00249AFEF0|nr:hypothetical protein [Paenibacillus amylolyticus]WFA83202.1 hypothetical protein OGI70_19495 [Paenibacillus amylolyticus]
MTLKTMLGVALALSVLISTHSANTATLASTNERQSTGFAHETEQSFPTSTPVLLIAPTQHEGRSAYNGSFTMVASNGTHANISIENNSNHTVYVKMYVDEGSEPMETSISRNSDKTINLLALQDTDIKLYIYSRIGHHLDLSVEAEQFH